MWEKRQEEKTGLALTEFQTTWPSTDDKTSYVTNTRTKTAENVLH